MRRFAKAAMAVAALALAALALVTVVSAQGAGFRRTMLGTVQVPEGQRTEVIFGVADVPPGQSSGAHAHYGRELGYVVEGTGELMVVGEPARRVGPGDFYDLTVHGVHELRSTGKKPLKVVLTWVVESGKPFVAADVRGPLTDKGGRVE